MYVAVHKIIVNEWLNAYFISPLQPRNVAANASDPIVSQRQLISVIFAFVSAVSLVFALASSLSLNETVTNALVTNQVDVGVQACVQGAGFGQFLSYHVLVEISAGRLVRILRKFEGESIPASIVYPSARHQSPNVRAFVAFAQPRLRERLQWLQKSGR